MYARSTYTILLEPCVTIRLVDRIEHRRMISKAQYLKHY
jgi:hypothetical protein